MFLVILGLWFGFVVGLFMGEVFVGPSGSLLLYGIAGAVIFALLAWPLQILRLWRRDGDPARAALMTIAKIPEAIGAAQYLLTRLRGRSGRIIEYK